MAKIMAINAGSSSLKFQLLEMPEEKVVTKGLVERIGMNDAVFAIEVNGEKKKETLEITDHAQAVKILLDKLTRYHIIESLNEIEGIGHRVVHGGEKFVQAVTIDDTVEKAIAALSPLAPLHNPPNLAGVRGARRGGANRGTGWIERPYRRIERNGRTVTPRRR